MAKNTERVFGIIKGKGIKGNGLREKDMEREFMLIEMGKDSG